MAIRILNFNTGRQYTAKGQRVTVQMDDLTGDFFFMDWDRGIAGKGHMRAIAGNTDDYAFDFNAKMAFHEYERCDYKMACEPGMWERPADGEFTLIQM